MSELRRRNMDLRRASILASARRVIAAEGIEALTLRDLARAAKVTVPTIYNLIGAREDVIAAICDDALDELDRRLEALPPRGGLARAEAIVTQSADLFIGEPETYRAVLRAVERQVLTVGPDIRGARALRRCAQLQAEACRLAAQDGDLAGELDPDRLGEQILGLYRIAMRDWEIGAIDGTMFVDQALYGLFTCLLADATPKSAPALRRRLQALQAGWRPGATRAG